MGVEVNDGLSIVRVHNCSAFGQVPERLDFVRTADAVKLLLRCGEDGCVFKIDTRSADAIRHDSVSSNAEQSQVFLVDAEET